MAVFNTPMRFASLLFLVLLTVGSAPGAFAQSSIRDLGGFRPSGVSDNGTVVSGRQSSSSPRRVAAIRWTEADSIVVLPSLSAFETNPYEDVALAVSADGSVLIGYGEGQYPIDGTSYVGTEVAVRWIGSAAPEDLGLLPFGEASPNSRGLAVSADGSVVVGYSEVEAPGFTGSGVSGTEQAIRWEEGTLTGLGWLDGGSNGWLSSSQATGVSADGSIIVGYSRSNSLAGCSNESGCVEAVLWGDEMQGLGALTESDPFSRATAVSADGRVVVGRSSSSTAQYGEAFRWENDQMVGLGVLPGDAESTALGVSADGSVIVGESEDADGNDRLFIWTAGTGMRALRDVLAAQDVDLDGWVLEDFGGLSSNGRFLVGFDGFGEAQRGWRIELEPGSDLVVTTMGDEPNDPASQNADVCDVDLSASGDQCTLRAALELAVTREEAAISFDIEGAGPHVIAPDSSLRELSKPIEIDATTQPGYADAPVVVLDGSSAGSDTHGLAVSAGGDGSRIAGLAVVGFGGDGIHIDTGQAIDASLSAEGITVEACWLGVGPGGSAGNGGAGLHASGQRIEIRENVISANRGEEGLYVLGFESQIEDNRIGTDASGTQALGNLGHGVTALALASIKDNVISGNQGYGLRMFQSQSTYNGDLGLSLSRTRVVGNRIGTDARGGVAVPNATGGVLMGGDQVELGAFSDGNQISGNGGSGVVVEAQDVLVTHNEIGVGRDRVLPNDGPGIWVRGISSGVGIGRDRTFGSHGGNTIVGNRGDGILVEKESGANHLVGVYIDRNDIGVDGSVAMPNEGAGIRVRGPVRSVEIGRYRLDPAGEPVGGTGNTIAGNAGPGVLIDGLGTDARVDIRGNQIGILTGDEAVIGNGSGIRIQESSNEADIGGEIWTNTILGNRGHGIALVGASSGYQIQGNAIGVNGFEGAEAGNQGAGVFLDGPDGIVVGCIASSCRETENEIAYNAGAGIRIGSGRRIQAARNTVYANAGGGIDLGGAGLTPNDLTDSDTGANDLLNAPVLLYAVDTRRRFSGYMQGASDTEYTLYFYANAPGTGCARGGCQMERYIGTRAVTTSEGQGVFREGFFAEIPLGETITAVAVDADGNTSEVGPGAMVVPTAQLLGVDVGPGIQGEVLKALGLSVDVTDNATRVATVQARQRAATPGADSLYVVRHDIAPRGWMYLEGSAMSPDGTTVTPDEVATAVYWSLTALGLDDVTYTACLELADIPATVPGQLVVVQRTSAWAPWTPLATTLSSDESAVCASGLTGFGELAVAGDSQVNPVADEDGPVAGSTALTLSVFPNPVRQRAVVRVELPQAATLTVEVFDAFGRRVRQLEASQRPAGRHDLTLDADGLAAGVYLVRMTPGDHRAPLVRRITVVR
ncbi:MAG: hypothetical protein Rubg2KO_24620 [Rubricoccaceae bacterium]